jgi:hypothetical protein
MGRKRAPLARRIPGHMVGDVLVGDVLVGDVLVGDVLVGDVLVGDVFADDCGAVHSLRKVNTGISRRLLRLSTAT